jgi:hypothetical protein
MGVRGADFRLTGCVIKLTVLRQPAGLEELMFI